MKKFLFLSLASLCLLLLASIAFASATASADDSIRGAPYQQDREGLYAAINGRAAAITLTETAIPTTWMVGANVAFVDEINKDAVVDVDNPATAVRSGVLAPAIKDFFTSNSASGAIFSTEKPVKEGVRHVLKKPIVISSSVKVVLGRQA